MNFHQSTAKTRQARPQIVILGAGFGGLNAALALKRANADITIIDRHNYHFFSLCFIRLPQRASHLIR